MPKRIITQLIFIVIGALVGYAVRNEIAVSDLSNTLGTLQNLSAAVFTLAGIWIAYIYPEAIQAFTKPEKVSLLVGSEKTERIESLVLVIFTSAFVLVSVLFYNLASAIMRNFSFVTEYRILLKVCATTFTIFLALNQTKAIIFVMISNIEFVNELHKNKTEQEANNDL